MITILVVDDERIISDGLKQIIEERLNKEVEVFNAYSAPSALEIFAKKKVDILLSDIQMPGVSGVELLEQVKISYPYCRVIFLTGFMVFDHVYKAVQYKNVKFLLKAEGYDEIIRTIEDTISEMEKERITEENLKRASIIEEQNKLLIRQKILLSIVNGDVEPNNLFFNDIKEITFSINLRKNLSMLMLRNDDKHLNLPYVIENKRQAFIQSILEKEIGAQFTFEILLDNFKNLIVLFQPKIDINWGVSEEVIPKAIEYIQMNITQHFSYGLSCISAGKVLAIDEIHKYYLNMHYQLNYLNYHSESVLIKRLNNSDSTESVCSNDKSFYYKLESVLSSLKMKLGMNDRNAYYYELNELLETHLNQHLESYSLISMFNSISMHILDQLYLFGFPGQELISEYSKILNLADWSSVKKYLLDISELAFQFIDESIEKNNISVIDKIKLQVHSCLLEPEKITLQALADYVYLSPSYLSRIFHATTGRRLSDYISEVRINYAKTMLLQHNVKISELAEKMGFHPASNFSRFFKQNTGKAPQEYLREYKE